MPEYVGTPLYGGAIVCDLPENFADVRCVAATSFPAAVSVCDGHNASVSAISLVAADNETCESKLRQVPDTQEVWIDKDGFTSIIFDITERVGGPGDGPKIDGHAITTHLEDMVGSDIDTVKIWNTAETEFNRLEYVF